MVIPLFNFKSSTNYIVEEFAFSANLGRHVRFKVSIWNHNRVVTWVLYLDIHKAASTALVVYHFLCAFGVDDFSWRFRFVDTKSEITKLVATNECTVLVRLFFQETQSPRRWFIYINYRTSVTLCSSSSCTNIFILFFEELWLCYGWIRIDLKRNTFIMKENLGRKAISRSLLS